MKTTDIEITPMMERQFLNGTLPGFLSTNPNFGLVHLLESQICEALAKKTGRRVVQKQRGVVIWN